MIVAVIGFSIGAALMSWAIRRWPWLGNIGKRLGERAARRSSTQVALDHLADEIVRVQGSVLSRVEPLPGDQCVFRSGVTPYNARGERCRRRTGHPGPCISRTFTWYPRRVWS